VVGELVKILADEPEKIEAALIRGIRILLSIIIASFFYTKIIGDYTLIPLNEYDNLINFIVSGRVLLCLFLFFSCDYIIIPVVESIASVPFWVLHKLKFGKLTDVDASQLLSFFGIIDTKDRNSMPLPGKNIDLLKAFVFSLNDEKAREEVTDLKNTVIKNVWNLYSIFLFIYFIVIDGSFHTHFLTTIVIFGYLLVFFMTYVMQVIFNYLFDKHQDIFKTLSFIKTYDIIQGFLKQYALFPIRGSKENGFRKAQIFTIANKEYILFIPTPIKNRKVNKHEIERLLKKRGAMNRIFIVILPVDMLEVPDEFFLELQDSLILISYSDEKHLEDQLRLTFDSISRKPNVNDNKEVN
jgi:hypothetical protein